MARSPTTSDFQHLAMLAGNGERPALSPDESLVVYGVVPRTQRLLVTGSPFLPSGTPRDVAGVELRVSDLDGAHCEVLTPGWGSSWGPRWSPDGRSMAFVSDRNGVPQIWLWERATASTRLVCESPVQMLFAFEGLHWLPDGTGLVAKLRSPGWNPPPGAPEPATNPRDVWTSPLDPSSVESAEEGWPSFDWSRGDIAVIDVRTGDVRRIGANVIPSGIAVSPDGRYVAAMCYHVVPGEREVNVGTFDLHVFAVDGSWHNVLAEGIAESFGLDFSWAPDSQALAYIDLGQGAGGGRLVVVALDGQQLEVYGDEETSLGHDEGFAPPLWSEDGSVLYCYGQGRVYRIERATGDVRNLAEGLDRQVFGIIYTHGAGTAPHFGHPGTIVVVTMDSRTRREGLFRIGDGAPVALVPEQYRHLVMILPSGEAGKRWIVGPVQSQAHPPDLFAFDGSIGKERRITLLNPQLEDLPRISARLIPMKGLQGESRQAVLWLPPGCEPNKPCPVVITPFYGYGAGFAPNLFDPNVLMLATRGYAVLQPNMVLVSEPEPIDAISKYALNALEAATEQGYADPERAGLMGHSRTGYQVCCAITRTDRFRAAVAVAPYTDLVSFGLGVNGNRLPWAGFVEGGEVRLGAPLWDVPQRYIHNSPVYHLDKVSTPLLLLCGTEDTPFIDQAEEMYGGLLRLGKVATLVRYNGEGHEPDWWSDENYEDYWTRILDWFDRYLQPCR